MYVLYLRVKEWYLGLPWYWKILGFLILIIMFLLLILSVLSGDREKAKQSETIMADIDNKQEKEVEDELVELQKKENEITNRIKKKKVEMATKINNAKEIDVDALKKGEEIKKATTMDDLDKIQEKYGL